VVKAGTKEGTIRIVTPLIALHKAEIVTLGLELNAPFGLTWSCYQREDRACGVCDSCVLRLRAFRDAGRKTQFRTWKPLPQGSFSKFRFKAGRLRHD